MVTLSLGKLLFIILVTKSLLFAEALKCYQCGQYNDGVGSITPCLNYTEKTAPFYLKDCKSSDAYCIVSESVITRNVFTVAFLCLLTFFLCVGLDVILYCFPSAVLFSVRTNCSFMSCSCRFV